MSDPRAIEPHSLASAHISAVAQNVAAIARQIGLRHGHEHALAEATGYILAAVLILTDICGPSCVRDTMEWHRDYAAIPLGPEAQAPAVLTDDGIPLPPPRTAAACSHDMVRIARTLAQRKGEDAALEAATGLLWAGVAIVREEQGVEHLAALLDGHARSAADVATSLAAMRAAHIAPPAQETLQ